MLKMVIYMVRKQLAKIRQENNETLKEVAEKAGVSPQYLSDVEQKKRGENVSGTIIEAYCQNEKQIRRVLKAELKTIFTELNEKYDIEIKHIVSRQSEKQL